MKICYRQYAKKCEEQCSPEKLGKTNWKKREFGKNVAIIIKLWGMERGERQGEEKGRIAWLRD